MERSRRHTHLRKLFHIGVAAYGLAAATVASAEMAEETMQLATGSAGTPFFALNPAVLEPQGTQGGVLLMRNSTESELDHSDSGGAKISSETQDEYSEAGLMADLGQGAGIAVTHQMLYRKTTTNEDGRSRDKEELSKIQHSAVKLIVELTKELRAGMAIRYLYKDRTVYGDLGLSESESTRYKTSLVGYGSGFTYETKSYGLSYTYFPPLRGKTEVYGEELIVVEPGEIAVDGYVQAGKQWRVGLLGKRWLNEVDDLAAGTTAEDNQTNISLYGLDPDQYLYPQQLVMVGFDYEVSKLAAVRLSAGQEKAEFNFKDLLVYNRVGVRARGDGKEEIKYTRVRAAASFQPNKLLRADVGLGLYSRKADFPDSMNGGSYKGSGKELYATIATGF